jgi:septal ring factor EnvC (AmiA/AmiB activator)
MELDDLAQAYADLAEALAENRDLRQQLERELEAAYQELGRLREDNIELKSDLTLAETLNRCANRTHNRDRCRCTYGETCQPCTQARNTVPVTSIVADPQHRVYGTYTSEFLNNIGEATA